MNVVFLCSQIVPKASSPAKRNVEQLGRDDKVLKLLILLLLCRKLVSKQAMFNVPLDTFWRVVS